MKQLSVPLALTEKGTLQNPKNAKKNVKYYCPLCMEEVILKAGNIKRPHFAHKPNSLRCTNETILHKTAKLAVYDKLKQLIATPSTPQKIFVRKCHACGEEVPQRLPEKVDKIEMEKKLPSGVIVDVAILSKGKIVAAIEIKVTHEVKEEKKRKIPVPFIEVEASHVIKNWPQFKLVPIQDSFKEVFCLKCKNRLRKFIKKAEKIAKSMRIFLPKTYYRFGIYNCYKCKREIIVFAWTDEEFSKIPPRVKPIPRTIQFRYSHTASEKYWVNICPFCNSIQGDFFLKTEPDGPFSGIYIDTFEPEEKTYQKNMFEIANHYWNNLETFSLSENF